MKCKVICLLISRQPKLQPIKNDVFPKMAGLPCFPKCFICLGRMECNAETNPQTDPRGGRKTPRPLPLMANNRKGETASPWQPALGSVYSEVAGRKQGGMCCDSWSLTRLSASLPTLMTQICLYTCFLLAALKYHGVLCTTNTVVWFSEESTELTTFDRWCMECKHGHVYKS